MTMYILCRFGRYNVISIFSDLKSFPSDMVCFGSTGHQEASAVLRKPLRWTHVNFTVWRDSSKTTELGCHHIPMISRYKFAVVSYVWLVLPKNTPSVSRWL